jgi:hypothetical protein
MPKFVPRHRTSSSRRSERDLLARVLAVPARIGATARTRDPERLQIWWLQLNGAAALCLVQRDARQQQSDSFELDRFETKPCLVISCRVSEARMYPNSKSHSQKMYNRAVSSLTGGNTRTTVFMKPYPIYAARGRGCRVWDVDGNEYIGCINNFTSLIHGDAHPAFITRPCNGSRSDRRSAGQPSPRSIWQSCSRSACRRSTRCASAIRAPRR